jgi:hypothetical protein
MNGDKKPVAPTSPVTNRFRILLFLLDLVLIHEEAAALLRVHFRKGQFSC